MKRLLLVIVALFLLMPSGYCKAKPRSACEAAGGQLVKIRECDNSESEWCIVSDKEQCYADQVINGRCSAGKYSEDVKGIVGITPRVLCDKPDSQ